MQNTDYEELTAGGGGGGFTRLIAALPLPKFL